MTATVPSIRNVVYKFTGEAGLSDNEKITIFDATMNDLIKAVDTNADGKLEVDIVRK